MMWNRYSLLNELKAGKSSAQSQLCMYPGGCLPGPAHEPHTCYTSALVSPGHSCVGHYVVLVIRTMDGFTLPLLTVAAHLCSCLES